MAHQWTDKIVLITGAATGIGALIVRYAVAEGAKHVAVLDINEKAGVSLQDELNSKHGLGRVKFYNCDVTDEDRLVSIFQSVKDDHGFLDVVINNAGIMNDSRKTYKKMIEINVIALVTGTIKGIDLMSKAEGGRGGTVINISSIVALFQGPLFPIYFGTKSAVLQFSNCVGTPEYFSKTGVRVITMCFGATDTPLLHINNVGCFDPDIQASAPKEIASFPVQKPESAARGVIDAYKQAENGSTWIATTDKPAKDITASVKQAYKTTSVHIFEE